MSRIVHHRIRGWLLKDQRVLESWLSKKIQIIDQRNRAPSEFAPVVQEFKNLVGADPEIYVKTGHHSSRPPRLAMYSAPRQMDGLSATQALHTTDSHPGITSSLGSSGLVYALFSSPPMPLYNIATNVKALDRFWLKGEPYSLNHMLNNDPFAPQFVGGTVYQAFLSALNYHRWHSPVNGKIIKTVMVPGTYYAESPAMGFVNPDGPDPSAPNLSQGFITALAARALLFIQADNPNIGLMCFIAVGMAEVSTCEITVKPGDVVRKGDQIGMFHFGGSTHCLVFRPQTKITFDPDYPINTPVELNAAIASVAG